MKKKQKIILGVLILFALISAITSLSFAFYQYSRIGSSKINVKSGDITFSYMEDNQNAGLVNAFPISDSVGAIDITGEYEFTVNLRSSASSTIANYNVILVGDNDDIVNAFTSDQIKFTLLKNDEFVANTSSTLGRKLSSITGFTTGLSSGEGIALENQQITAGSTDTYKLRIWISDDVDFTGEILDDGTMIGKYNGYSYSLKVKVTATS